ncbi:MAG: hypothetical protein AAGA56_10475, partial [Myxococcota bacterium]
MSFWHKVSAPALIIGLASPALINCDSLGSLPGVGCPGLESGDFSNLKVEGGVEAQVKGILNGVVNLK